jgi:RHS repeat-associated protein
MWGRDLSGSLQGAGGVGGLIARSDGATHFASFDGHGNVAGLVNGADGTSSAKYEYSPFGELIRSSGAAADKNQIGFSTKYADRETGWGYFGARYLADGRWTSRDPLGEGGGNNLSDSSGTIP